MKFTKLLAALFALALVAAACGGAEDVVEGATDVVDEAAEAVDGDEEDEAMEDDEEVDAEADADAAAAASGSLDVDAILAADPACGSPVSGDPIVVGYAADFSDLGGFADGPGSEAVGHFINCLLYTSPSPRD